MRMRHPEGSPRAPRATSTPLERAFETPDAKRAHVRELFDTIAPKYDLITRLLSFDRDRYWKRRLIDLAGVRDGQAVVDLACGTGDLALLAAGRGASVVGLDIVPAMIRLARARPGSAGVRWLVGDMGRLPIAGESADVVLTGYGLRNVPDLPATLAEIHRVLRAGGTLGALDFERPESAWVRRVYLTYLRTVGGLLGRMLHGDPDTYRYIPASLERYPGARAVARMLRDAGFQEVSHRPVFAGFMAIHIARK